MIDKHKIPIEVLDTLNKLNSNGLRSFLVGGSLRDLLLDKNPKDFDICTEAVPEDVKRIFNKVIDTGLKFGTVTVLIGDVPIEITTFRKKGCHKTGFRQEATEFGQSEIEDVKARDFTINALLFDGQEINDYVNGLADLRDKVIRAVGRPDCRFKEDALRMMRAIRLCCQLGFVIEQSTLEAIATNALLIENVAQERIRDELVKILLSGFPAKGIRLMRKTGLLQYVLPELQACYKFDQHNSYHDKDVFGHTMAVLENTPNKMVVRLAALLHDIAKPITFTQDSNGVGHFYAHDIEGYGLAKQILSGLKFDNETIDSVGILVKEHMNKLKVFHKAAVKKLINRVGPNNIHLLIDLQIADETGSSPPHDFKILKRLRVEVEIILSEKEPMSLRDLAVNGTDIIELGVRPGPELGKILNQLLEKVICNPELNNREDLLRIVSEELLTYPNITVTGSKSRNLIKSTRHI